jgi:hypothetical protein
MPVLLIVKTPSRKEAHMVIGLMKKGWRTKSKVSTEQFSGLLSNALYCAASYRDSEDLYEVVGLGEGLATPDQWATYFKLMQDEFARLHSPMEQLSSIAPDDARLGDVHFRAIGFLRGFLQIQELNMGIMVGQAQKNERLIQKSIRDLDGWERTVEEVRGDFARDLHKLSVQHPALYQQLGLSSHALGALRLMG